MSQAAATVLTFEEARAVVEQHTTGVLPTGPETVELARADGRVLADALVADRDFPPFPRSARDGYAVRAADLARVPAILKITGESKAGAAPGEAPAQVRGGEAVLIMTGAPVPTGADAVVMVEYTSRDDHTVEIQKSAGVGENIVPRGSEGRAGEVLLKPGHRLDAAGVAVAASVGKASLQVHALPRVAILATGDEIVDVAAIPGPNQIRNSNSYSLAAQVRAAGGLPVLLPIAPDELKQLRRLIEQGLQADLLLLAGGVSMGKYDLVEQALGELGAEFFFTGALIQPGRPVVFGRAGEKYFFGLPGNPVSTMVTFELFAGPILEALGGATPRPLAFFPVRLRREIKVRTGLTRFLPGLLSGQFGDLEVELAPWQGSGDMAAAARANCYVVVPPDRERIAAGETVKVWLRS
ncbi:MAG TPA: gephyrin-like molybdotransferase Glp [Terriglobales bacterium]|nr:gephyrin-like molybdotransferase Glp [Terriglobales bacterium]